MVNIAIYADGADLASMATLADKVEGFTTNPSLMRKSGIGDYRAFAREVLAVACGKPVSFEVFADDFSGMECQAREIASWGRNVYVKIPVTNTSGEPSFALIQRLADAGVKVNVTAVFTREQVQRAIAAIGLNRGIVSVFAGRIADTGRDPCRIMRSARAKVISSDVLLLWASAREVYNVVQAEEAGCDIITLSPELIAKLDGFGMDLAKYSLETVRQFHRDAAGLAI